MTTDPAEALLSGAEPFEFVPAAGSAAQPNSRVGVLLCHGFTGSPHSLRPWADHLAGAGFRVSLPLLPGHGRTDWRLMQDTTWHDWYEELDKARRQLVAACDEVFVMGLSMGGGLALRLAEEHGSEIRGLVLVNPSVRRNAPREVLIPLAARLLPSLPGVASDIKKPGVTEVGYERVPLRAAHSLARMWAVVQADLGRVAVPVLLFRSARDHVVHRANAAMVLARIASRDVTEVVLPDSYHVATLDNDAPTIFTGSVDFIRRVSAVPGVGAAEPAADAGTSAEATR